MKTYSIPILVSKNLSRRIEKKKKNETKFVKKHCTLDQQNKFEQHSTHSYSESLLLI